MKNTITKVSSLLLTINLLFQLSGGIAAAGVTALPEPAEFSDQELDQLFSPIALYPDPLLAQVIPAATFIDQVVQANQVLKGSVNEKLIEPQAWDVSVKSVAHYPQVLAMMATQRDWSTAVGQAYVYQSTDVMKSIQRLRALAKGSGALVSTPQQIVAVEKEYITIVPAQPQVIYVPVYDPQVVYVSTGPPPGAVAISFGVGLAIGAWLNRDWHWYGPGIYYHGWVGRGWIGVSRTHVHINRVYVNRSFTHININRTIVNRNVTHFRADLNNRVVTGRHLDINRGNSSRDFNRRPSTTPARSGTARRNTSVPNSPRQRSKPSTANRPGSGNSSAVRSTPKTTPKKPSASGPFRKGAATSRSRPIKRP